MSFCLASTLPGPRIWGHHPPTTCLGRRESTYHQKHKILTFLAPQHWEQACNQGSSTERTYSTLPWNLVTQKGGVSENHFPVKVDTGSRGNLVVLVESFNTNISDVGIAWCSICAQSESRRVSTGPVLLHDFGHHSWLQTETPCLFPSLPTDSMCY